MRTGRWVLGIGLLPAAMLGGAATLLAVGWRDRLPQRLPNSGGVGDRPVLTTISVDGLTAVLGGSALAVWLLGLLVFALSRRVPGAGRHWLRLGAQVAGWAASSRRPPAAC